MKENQISQVKELSTFLCMGRCKSLGSRKSCLWYVPQLSGASIMYFHITSFFRVHHREWLQSHGCWIADILFFPEFPQGSTVNHPGGCNCQWLWHPSFTQMARNIPFFSPLQKLTDFLVNCLWGNFFKFLSPEVLQESYAQETLSKYNLSGSIMWSFVGCDCEL